MRKSRIVDGITKIILSFYKYGYLSVKKEEATWRLTELEECYLLIS